MHPWEPHQVTVPRTRNIPHQAAGRVPAEPQEGPTLWVPQTQDREGRVEPSLGHRLPHTMEWATSLASFFPCPKESPRGGTERRAPFLARAIEARCNAGLGEGTKWASFSLRMTEVIPEETARRGGTGCIRAGESQGQGFPLLSAALRGLCHSRPCLLPSLPTWRGWGSLSFWDFYWGEAHSRPSGAGGPGCPQ